MPIRVNLPGGDVANFPDGTPPAEIERALAAHTSQPAAEEPGLLQSGWNFVKNHPTEVGAMLGGIAAVPLTGGASLPAAIAAAGLGGAGGAGLGMIAGAAGGSPNLPNTAGGVLRTMGEQGATQAAAEAGGGLVSKGLQATGRGLYRAALRPAARLTDKYGDLVGAGLQEGAPIGSSGRIVSDMRASKAATDTLAQQAEAAGKTVPTSAVTDKYLPLVETAGKREALGVPGDLNEIAARESAFNAAHPTGQIQPTRALELKREADALASTAQNALRRGNAVNDMTAQLHNATRAGLQSGLESVAPDMAAQNARTSTLYGLSRALRAAENRPHALSRIAADVAGVGGAMFGGNDLKSRGEGAGGAYAAIRLAASPALQSRLGILANAAGATRLPANALRAAMLAALSGQEEDTATPSVPAGAELLRR